ncbi:MAG TPA: (p)ppGpp synthetase [Treponema sp.]|nr:(p)ppGpp synthetase [Treponema sp.]
MKNIPNQDDLRKKFEAHAERRVNIVRELSVRIEETLAPLSVHPTIKGRTKNFDSYYKKVLKILKSGGTLPQITDLMGVRVVCPFIENLSVVEELITKTFDMVEIERKGHYTFREFGYESTHLLIKIPPDITAKHGKADTDVAEIQIRTILQDAWAEVEHELVYKAEFNPFDTPMKRKLAAVNASLSLADIIFQEIRTYQRQLNGELAKRRESFFHKIEDANDAFLFSGEMSEPAPEMPIAFMEHTTASIDDMLLLALSAHNGGRFDEATTLYSRILELNPEKSICALIYKHRGMANFAQSKYNDAIDDFSRSLEMDDKSYKVYYYRGVVKSVTDAYPDAIEDFSRSLEINPYQSFCLFRRGQAYYHSGDYPRALADCEASLAMEPANEAAKKFKDLLHKKLRM